MIKQYLSIKDAYPDTLLFYRMGDFYEMFFEDAEIASRALEITLTSRNKNDQVPVPMCGVPVRAVKGYIARLIESGFKVAICEQVEDPAQAKGLVKREVTRIITPGMIVDDAYLDARANNYLLALNARKNVFGLAYLDISTGTFRVCETDDAAALLDEARRVKPGEIILPQSWSQKAPGGLNGAMAAMAADEAVSFIEDTAFGTASGKERLLNQFEILSLEGFGCEHLPAAIGAAGALLYYTSETQKQKVAHFSHIETYRLKDHLWLDDISCRNLELFENIVTSTKKGTLMSVMDHCVTAMGARKLVGWMRYPLMDKIQILARQEAVAEAFENGAARTALRESLKAVYDLERLNGKISMGQANGRDLTALKRSLQVLPAIWQTLEEMKAESFRFDGSLNTLLELAQKIDDAIREDAPPVINEGGMIKSGYSPELDELISLSRDGKKWLLRLESEQKAATGISTLKVRYNKVFGYYIEVPKSQAKAVPAHYVRKQTLVNAERYITDELKTFENQVLRAEERRAVLELEIFNAIRAEVRALNDDLQQMATFIARLDCLLNLAEIADLNDYHRPQINSEGRIVIEDGRHPVVEKMIAGERFVPNSVTMDNEANQVLIITGPNMAGKSTILRQVALLTIMAQMGSFLPANKADMAICDRIFTRVGALDNLSQGQSTFMVEMQETANILNNAGENSLVVMDEIGRGTSTYDGFSIAWAVATHLHDVKGKGVKTLFATHYHELTDLERTKERVKNYNIAVKEWNDEIIFLRKLVKGGTNRSYGIQVARLAGIPETVITQAKKILFAIENGSHDLAKAAGPKNDVSLKGNAHKQLGLFGPPEQAVVEQILSADLSRMTPLDALNYLSRLQEQAKDVSSG